MATTPVRYVAARLQIRAEPGTILGPRDITGEYLAVLDDGHSLSYAGIDDLRAAMDAPEPRSVTEARLRIAGRIARREGSP